MERLGGLILAAGMSSRMGAYKPLINIHGRSMIEHVIDSMKSAGGKPIVVVTGYRCADLEAHLKNRENIEFVHNFAYAKTQQLDSLKLGLSVLEGRCRQVMISPADVPMVDRKTIEQLMDLEGDFIRPLFHGEPGHPVFLKTEWIPYIKAYQGGGGLRGAVENHPQIKIVDLEVNDKGVILDNDTKEDLARLFRWQEEKNQYV